MTIPTTGNRSPISVAALSPDPGIEISSSATSGRYRAVSAMASAAEPASATTSNRPLSASERTTPPRNNG